MRGAVVLALLLGACGTSSLDRVAETSFTLDHRGCAPSSLERRPDQPAHGDATRYEIFGCGDHAAYFCVAYSVGSDGTVYGPSCSGISYCTGQGCARDFAAAAHAQFVKDAMCPAERVTVVDIDRAPPQPPAAIAADAERLRLWNDRTQKVLDGALPADGALETARGCDTERFYACTPHAPGAPTCAVVLTPAL
ncbi:MAG TPA: hypothetical protein VGL86_00955 [Polyangia bacterium]|jgi:hypothetical protein